MSDKSDSPSWWLHQDGNATGPYTENYITAGLKSNVIPLDARACLVGSEEWKPIDKWPILSGLISANSVPVLPNHVEPNTESPFSNPQLPKMANWICLYCILIRPVLLSIGLLTLVLGDSGHGSHTSKIYSILMIIFFLELLFYSCMTVFLMIGGLRLRALRQSGRKIIKRILWGNFAFVGLGILIVFMVVLFCPVDFFDGEKLNYHEASTTQSFISYFNYILFSVEFVFQIFALIWLHKKGAKLRLTDS